LKDWPLAAFAAVTTAPATVFPVGSVTMPASEPSLDCANEFMDANNPMARTQMKTFSVDFMYFFRLLNADL
jgi:hypothetical protein